MLSQRRILRTFPTDYGSIVTDDKTLRQTVTDVEGLSSLRVLLQIKCAGKEKEEKKHQSGASNASYWLLIHELKRDGTAFMLRDVSFFFWCCDVTRW